MRFAEILNQLTIYESFDCVRFCDVSDTLCQQVINIRQAYGPRELDSQLVLEFADSIRHSAHESLWRICQQPSNVTYCDLDAFCLLTTTILTHNTGAQQGTLSFLHTLLDSLKAPSCSDTERIYGPLRFNIGILKPIALDDAAIRLPIL